jgi:tetrahydromethanopterin S-methyltransferase subunit D
MTEKPRDRVRQGTTGHGVRFVLVISTLLGAAALVAVYLIFI